MITTEDVTGIDFSTRPEEITIVTFAGRPVAFLRREAIADHILTEIARAVVDQGWRYGARFAACTFRRLPRPAIVIRIAYAT